MAQSRPDEQDEHSTYEQKIRNLTPQSPQAVAQTIDRLDGDEATLRAQIDQIIATQARGEKIDQQQLDRMFDDQRTLITARWALRWALGLHNSPHPPLSSKQD